MRTERIESMPDEEFQRLIDKKGLKELAKAILKQPPPPCKEFSCENYMRCANEKLACRAFSIYVTNGAVISPLKMTPTAATYKHIFPE